MAFKANVTSATKSRDFDARRQSPKCDRACRTLHRDALHSCATRFRNTARRILYARVKDARQNRRCDIGLTPATLLKQPAPQLAYWCECIVLLFVGHSVHYTRGNIGLLWQMTHAIS